MKTEFIDVSDTKKNLVVEIPSTIVDAEIDKSVARLQPRRPHSGLPAREGAGQGGAAAVPRPDPSRCGAWAHPSGGRRGAARARRRARRHTGHQDVVVEEGQPLKFTATFETVPPIDPGDYSGLTLRKKSVSIDDDAVEQALEQLRERAARYEPVEDRGIANGDSVLMDMVRTAVAPRQGRRRRRERRARGTDGSPREHHGRHRGPGESTRLRRATPEPLGGRIQDRSTWFIRPTTPSRSSPARRSSTT